MSFVTSSGQIIPTDEHQAMLLEQARQSLLSQRPTTPMPLVGNPISPLPPVSNKWRPPEKVVPCTLQQIRMDALARTTFGLRGTQYRIEDAPREEWLLFLVQAGVAVQGYDEGQGYPGLYRREYANSLIKQGVLELLRTGNEDEDRAPILLAIKEETVQVPVLPTTTTITCEHLDSVNRWRIDYCCPECHDDPSLLIEEYIAGDDPLQGKAGRRGAMLCCTAVRFLGEYHGQMLNSGQLRTHGNDDAIEEI